MDIAIDVSAYHAAWTAEVRNLERGAELAVEIAGKAGETVARLAAPVRNGWLRDGIRFRSVSSGARGATGELRADAKHSSLVAEGTRPHVIQARRKKALRFIGSGGETFRKRVMHPGYAGNSFWRDALEVVEIRLVRAGENVVNGVCARMSR